MLSGRLHQIGPCMENSSAFLHFSSRLAAYLMGSEESDTNFLIPALSFIYGRNFVGFAGLLVREDGFWVRSSLPPSHSAQHKLTPPPTTGWLATLAPPPVHHSITWSTTTTPLLSVGMHGPLDLEDLQRRRARYCVLGACCPLVSFLVR